MHGNDCMVTIVHYCIGVAVVIIFWYTYLDISVLLLVLGVEVVTCEHLRSRGG